MDLEKESLSVFDGSIKEIMILLRGSFHAFKGTVPYATFERSYGKGVGSTVGLDEIRERMGAKGSMCCV